MRRTLGYGIAALALVALIAFYVTRPKPTETPAPVVSATTQPVSVSKAEPEFSPPKIAPAVSRYTPEQDEEYRRWTRAVVDALIARDDGESLIVAALIIQYRGNADPLFADVYPDVVKLFARASQRAPTNASVQWLTLTGCRGAVERKVACDVTGFESALMAADPANGIALLGELERARQRADRQEMERVVGMMANAAHMGTYYASVEPMLLNTIESVRVPPPVDRVGGYPAPQLLAIGVSASLPLPNLQHVRDACKVKPNDPIATHCISVTATMRQSDSYFVRRVGLRVAEDFWPVGFVKAVENGEEQRTLDWLAHQVGQLPYGPEVMQRLLPQAGGEVELWKAWLTENGIPLQPPIDWAKP